MLDLPTPGHLLDDELGVHPDLQLGVGGMFAMKFETGDEPTVFGHVVGGHPDRLGPFGDDLTGVGIADERAVSGRSGIAPGAAVGFHDDPHG